MSEVKFQAVLWRQSKQVWGSGRSLMADLLSVHILDITLDLYPNTEEVDVNVTFILQGCKNWMFSLMKRASEPHLKGSICGIAAARLRAGDFLSFSQAEVVSGSKREGQPSRTFFFEISQKKGWTEVKGEHKHLYVVKNPSLFTEEKSQADICVFMCVCLRSTGRPLTFLCSSCLSSSSSIVGLFISTCSSEICSWFCLFASSCSTHRQERGSRGEAYRGLRLSVFKGVSTPHFCIIHITPQRWSISRLQRENRAISWRDTSAAGTQTHHTQIHTHNILHFYCQMRGWDRPCGADSCVAAFKTTFTALTSWGSDPTPPPERAPKT